jgi:hypothetical protein
MSCDALLAGRTRRAAAAPLWRWPPRSAAGASSGARRSTGQTCRLGLCFPTGFVVNLGNKRSTRPGAPDRANLEPTEAERPAARRDCRRLALSQPDVTAKKERSKRSRSGEGLYRSRRESAADQSGYIA